MDLNSFRKKCSAASVKIAVYGSWWAVNWDENDLVKYKGSKYIPHSVRFNYHKGHEVNVAILHDLLSCTEYNKPLEEVEENV